MGGHGKIQTLFILNVTIWLTAIVERCIPDNPCSVWIYLHSHGEDMATFREKWLGKYTIDGRYWAHLRLALYSLRSFELIVGFCIQPAKSFTFSRRLNSCHDMNISLHGSYGYMGVTRGQYLHGHAKHIDSKDTESAEVCHEVSRDHRRRLADRELPVASGWRFFRRL